jgi:hypothetical protein
MLGVAEQCDRRSEVTVGPVISSPVTPVGRRRSSPVRVSVTSSWLFSPCFQPPSVWDEQPVVRIGLDVVRGAEGVVAVVGVGLFGDQEDFPLEAGTSCEPIAVLPPDDVAVRVGRQRVGGVGLFAPAVVVRQRALHQRRAKAERRRREGIDVRRRHSAQEMEALRSGRVHTLRLSYLSDRCQDSNCRSSTQDERRQRVDSSHQGLGRLQAKICVAGSAQRGRLCRTWHAKQVQLLQAIMAALQGVRTVRTPRALRTWERLTKGE